MPLMPQILIECGPRPIIALHIVADPADYTVFTPAGSPGPAANVPPPLATGTQPCHASSLAWLPATYDTGAVRNGAERIPSISPLEISASRFPSPGR